MTETTLKSKVEIAIAALADAIPEIQEADLLYTREMIVLSDALHILRTASEDLEKINNNQ
jgi:hypothetical protein